MISSYKPQALLHAEVSDHTTDENGGLRQCKVTFISREHTSTIAAAAAADAVAGRERVRIWLQLQPSPGKSSTAEKDEYGWISECQILMIAATHNQYVKSVRS